MEKLAPLRLELWQTFSKLDDARGEARQRYLRRARILLLLADELLREPELGGELTPPEALPVDAVSSPTTVLQILADNATAPVHGGACRGLQTVLVLRNRRNDGE